jgi:hypothetical protein
MRQLLPSPKLVNLITRRRRDTLEKQLATAAFWIAVLSTAIALITRLLALLGIFAFSTTVVSGRNPLSYRTFLEGAILFFLMAIASGVLAWGKGQKV